MWPFFKMRNIYFLLSHFYSEGADQQMIDKEREFTKTRSSKCQIVEATILSIRKDIIK